MRKAMESVMTKKRSSEFSTAKNCRFWGKIPKKVVLKFFGLMCSGEFFLKHALGDGTPPKNHPSDGTLPLLGLIIFIVYNFSFIWIINYCCKNRNTTMHGQIVYYF